MSENKFFKLHVFLLILPLLCLSPAAFAQIEDPVKWSFTAENVTANSADLVIKADIDAGWHVYSQFIDDGGPVPTSFEFTPSKAYSRIGKVTEEPKAVSAFDPNFDMQIAWHEKRVIFRQRIKLNTPETTVSGVLSFMVCNDTKCLPPTDVEFSIPINSAAAKGGAKQATAAPQQSDTAINTGQQLVKPQPDSGATVYTPLSKPVTSNSGQPAPSTSFWGIFLAGFLGGIAAFFMPCIYPMIPLTVSYFTKKSGSRAKGIRSAGVYGLSIIIIYVALGMLITFIFGASALNEAASSAVFNLLFFLLLVVFALSFLGAFEITLPSSLVNKMDERSNRGGFIGLFFMAFTLVLVSFSCTGPIIGTLLVEAVSKGAYLGPASGMLGFSAALAIPFTLFAIFPSWLKEMPKSGGWLNAVKVSLGFLELALAFKFLSNVDLAYHWGILDRDLFLSLWIVIFGLWSFYLLGKIRFAHDNPLQHLSLTRLFFAIAVLSFTIYMIPGLWGAPLKGISAWLPPQQNQDFDLYTNRSTALPAGQTTTTRKYSNLFHAPHGLDAFYDYDEALAFAKQVNKPLLLDFTGWSCTNCRKMEASVWAEPEVLSRLKNDFVLVSLYVDDRTGLARGEQYTSGFSNKKIKTVGQKWSDLQATKFATNSQPYYVILGHNEKPLVPPQAFNLDVENYVQFLKSGKQAFSSK